MPTRVVALLLALVLLWSGFSTVEAPRVLAQATSGLAPAIVDGLGQAAQHEGSVEHHHLDDLPSQAQNDAPTESPGLLPAVPTTRTLSGVRVQPRTWVSAEAGPPFLAGPLRPPCRGAFAG
jgi:hypothetical protein